MKIYESGILLMFMAMWNYFYVFSGREASLDYFMGGVIAGFMLIIIGIVLNYVSGEQNE